MSEAEKPSVPPPILLSAIICDTVIIDRISDKPSIIGAFETINAPRYPARHPRLVFFCQLTNGRSRTNVSIKLVDVEEEDKRLFEATGKYEFKDIRQVANMTFDIGGIVFPHPGEYRFQIFVDDELLGERRIICRQVKLPSGDKNDASE
jgi:hypothetical protein